MQLTEAVKKYAETIQNDGRAVRRLFVDVAKNIAFLIKPESFYLFGVGGEEEIEAIGIPINLDADRLIRMEKALSAKSETKAGAIVNREEFIRVLQCLRSEQVYVAIEKRFDGTYIVSAATESEIAGVISLNSSEEAIEELGPVILDRTIANGLSMQD